MVARTNVMFTPGLASAASLEGRIPPRLDHLRMRLQVGLMLIDVGALAVGGAIANILWIGNFNDLYNRGAVLSFMPLYILMGLNGGAFTTETLSTIRAGVMRALQAVLLAGASVVLAAFFLKQGEHISRVTLLIDILLGGVLLLTARIFYHGRVKRRYGAKLHNEVLILDGCDRAAPAGMFVLDAQKIGLRCDVRDPMMLDRIGRMLKPADRVVIACRSEQRRNWAMVMKGANIHAEIVSDDLTALGPIGTGRFGSESTVVVAAGSLDLRQRLMKRALDMTLALLALVALAPLLALVALAVRMDSVGPVLFVQDRIGRGNRLFGIYKFRSMYAEHSDGAGNRSTTRSDSRITPVGRVLRSSSIDELPQLLNILKGDMSFVGPRPHALGSLAGDLLFWEVDERYWHRHACKPGLTGLAQVRGFRGATLEEVDLTNRLQADLEYMAGWTIWRDVSIIIATLRVVLHRNAY